MVLPTRGWTPKLSTSCWRRRNGRAVALSQTIIFVQHVDFNLQHPPLTHTCAVPASRRGRNADRLLRFDLGKSHCGVLMPVILQRRRFRQQRARYETLSAGLCSSPSICAVAFSATAKSYNIATPDLSLCHSFLPDGDASVYPALIFSFINLYAP